MDFKLVSKNNVGAVLLLLFVIIVSQSKMLNFLLNTYLGRAFLILLLLVLAYLHKIFGVVAVLLIVILFNNSDMAYLEGFAGQDASGGQFTQDASGGQFTQDVSGNDASGNASGISPPPPMVIAAAKNNASSSSQVGGGQIASQNATPGSGAGTTGTSGQVNVVTPGTNVSKPAGTEGFNILGMENEIRRGKNSNSLPVNPFMRDATNVAPYEGSPFKESFTLF